MTGPAGVSIGIHMKVTLFQKGMLFILVPVLVQTGLMIELAKIQRQTETELRRAALARDISETINASVNNIFQILQLTDGKSWETGTFDNFSFSRAEDELKGNLATLRRLIEDPKDLAILEDAQESVNRWSSEFDSMVRDYNSGAPYEELKLRMRTLRNSNKTALKSLTRGGLLTIMHQQKEIAATSPALVAKGRERTLETLGWALLLDVLIAASSIFYLSRAITGRLAIIAQNSLKLVSDQPLGAPLRGSDEIAELDGTFHAMAEALRQMKQRERAIVDNALDVICTTDDALRFTALNSASRPVFGFDQEELLGSRLIGLVHPDDVTNTSNTLEWLVSTDRDQRTLENRIIKKDGTIADMQWSLHWNRSQGALFCVARDISDIKKAERMRQEVIQMITHDLRSPLSAIRNFHEMLEDGMCGDLNDRGQNLLQAAERTSDRMMRLISELLDLEKIKAGMMTLSVEEASLQEIFDAAAASVPAASNNVSIQVEPTEIKLRCDQDRIIQLIVNLLANAVKFSPTGEKVILAANDTGEAVEISVTDHGRGIPADKLAAIFEPFEQVQVSDATVRGGTGLGLAICKGLAELHGGTISATSEEGVGSRFSVVLPVRRLPVPAQSV